MNRTPHPVLIAERNRDLVILGPRPPWWRPWTRARHRRIVAAVMERDVSVWAWQQREFLREAYPADAVAEMAMPQDRFCDFLRKGLQGADIVWTNRKEKP